MQIADVMTADVVTVRPDAPLHEVAQLLVEHRITGLPVVDGDGALVGVVSGADLLPKEMLDGPRRARARRAARTAGEAMSSPPVCVAADEPLVTAADLMARHRIQRLPVVDGAGALVGIVTRADLVRAFARPDEEVAAELREVFGQEGIDVDVAAGEVTLRGTVGSRVVADELVRRAQRVAGVVGVTPRLLWGSGGGSSAPFHFLYS